MQAKTVNVRTYRHGEVIRTLDFQFLAEEHGAPYLLVARADLHRVLLRRAESLGVKIKLDAKIGEGGIEVAAGRVILESGEVYEGDLILGADGERSICRRLVLGYQDDLQSTGDEIFRFAVKVSDIEQSDLLRDLVHEAPINYWMGPNSHVVSYVMSKGDMLNMILTTPEENEHNVAAGVQMCDVSEIRAKIRSWDPRFEQLLDFAQGCSKWNLMQGGETNKWVHPQGKLLLIGDSAHAMLPYLCVNPSSIGFGY